MLVLTRKTQQQIQIGNNITITILQVKGQAVRVGIEAPRDVRILRCEVAAKDAESVEADEESTSGTVHVTKPRRTGAVRPSSDKGAARAFSTPSVAAAKPARLSLGLSGHLDRRASVLGLEPERTSVVDARLVPMVASTC